MTPTQTLADAIVETLNMERDAAGWTLSQLSEEIGLSTQTLGRYLTRRERVMPISVLVETCAVIGVSVAEIVDQAERRLARNGPRRRDTG